MSELTYFLLKMAFLALMWGFVFAVVFAIRTDLFGPRVRVLARAERKKRRRTGEQSAPPAPPATAPQTIPPVSGSGSGLGGILSGADTVVGIGDGIATTASARTLSIIEGPRAGHDFVLSDEPITIGRSMESSLVLRDDFTSTNHARVFLRGDTWMIEDQGSTNGTSVGGVRIAEATPIPLNTPISIGTSVLELRR